MADGNWFDVIYKLNSIFSTRFAAVCARGYHFMYGVSYIYNIYICIYTHTILAQHIQLSAGRLFRNIHQSLHYSSVLLTHSRVLSFLFFIFFHAWTLLHCRLCRLFSPGLGHNVHNFRFYWSFAVTVTISITVSEPELIFRYHGQWK